MSYSSNVDCIGALPVRSFVRLSVSQSVSQTIVPFFGPSIGCQTCVNAFYNGIVVWGNTGQSPLADRDGVKHLFKLRDSVSIPSTCPKSSTYNDNLIP